MSDDVRFGGTPRPKHRGRLLALCALLMFVILGFSLTQVFRGGETETTSMPLAEQIVEVRGEVPAPGLYALEPPLRVHAALTAAGVDELGRTPDAELEPGTRIVVDGEGYRLESMDRPLLIGLPVHLNEASQDTLQSIPGIGPVKAAEIIREREQGGPFETIEDLERVQGIGPATIEEIRPFVEP